MTGADLITALCITMALLAMVVVIVLLARTTRKVVDRNEALANLLVEKDRQLSAAISPLDKIRQDAASMEQPGKMDDVTLMRWLDDKMEETLLYRQPDMDIKSASETLGLSQRRIMRLMKSQPQLGTFSVYLTEKRLAKACELLKEHPEFTVEGICLDVGFSTRRAFQRIFKQRIGMSPSEYRNSVIKKDNQQH